MKSGKINLPSETENANILYPIGSKDDFIINGAWNLKMTLPENDTTVLSSEDNNLRLKGNNEGFNVMCIKDYLYSINIKLSRKRKQQERKNSRGKTQKIVLI